MDSIRKQAHILAQVIKTENQEMITRSIMEFDKLPATETLTKSIDEANLPHLIDVHAPVNEVAQQFVGRHRNSKKVKMDQAKPALLNAFRQSVEKKYNEQEVPQSFFKILCLMIQVPNYDVVVTALQLLTSLDCSLKDYRDVIDFATDMRHEIMEAEILYQKIQGKLSEFDVVDEEMDVDLESEMEERIFEHNQAFEEDRESAFDESEFSDQEPDISDVSILSHVSGSTDVSNVSDLFAAEYDSAKSGLESDSEGAPVIPSQRLQDPIPEVLMMLLAQSLEYGDTHVIISAIGTLGEFPFSLDLFRKYEITALIRRYASQCDAALKLSHKIAKLDEDILAKEHKEVFDNICRCITATPKVGRFSLNLLMVYLKTGVDEQIESVTKLLLSKDVTLKLYQQHNAVKILEKLPRKTRSVDSLIQMITEMKEANV